MSYNNFSGLIPTELGLLSNLKELDFSFNKLTGSIPSELGLLTYLTSINLSGNELIGTFPFEVVELGIDVFPPSIPDLTFYPRYPPPPTFFTLKQLNRLN